MTKNLPSVFKSLKCKADNEDEIERNNNDFFELSIPEEFRQEVNRRMDIIESWKHKRTIERDDLWKEDFLVNHKVSERTIRRWCALYNENGIEGLIPNHQKKGRKSKFHPKVHELVEKARKVSLKRTKTQESAFSDLKKACKKKEKTCPSFDTFKYYIYKNSTASERALLTRGKRYHQTHFNPSIASFMQAILPMQVLQLDNTSFDIFPVDSKHRSPIGTPNITTAIDCYTRMITGFYLTLSSCSSLTILETLVQTILPKSYYEETYKTESPWPIQGFPVLILVDNGMDYRSKDVKRFCMDYNVILEFAPLKQARYKAYIEKWFDILHNGIKQEDIGGLRPKLKYRLENPDLRPEEEAMLTMHEIQTWTHQWIVDEYHFRTSYNDHLPAPYIRWERAKKCQTDIILPLPRDPPQETFKITQLILAALKKKEINLTNKGVQFLNLKFRNTELDRIYNIKGKNKVTVLIDRRNIRNLWVINPINTKPIKTELGEGWASVILDTHGDIPIDIITWKRTCKEIRKHNIREITPYTYHKFMSKRKREKLIAKGRDKTKRSRRKREKIIENEERNTFTRLSQKSLEKLDSDIFIENSQKGVFLVENKSKIKKKRKKIDWSKLKPLPTQKMARLKGDN